MNPFADDLFNEKGEAGKADGLFYIEDRLYKATLIARRRWRTPGGRPRQRIVTSTFAGYTARDLARSLRASGWEPPRGLARLCEASRHV
jgi:hypothetical protein